MMKWDREIACIILLVGLLAAGCGGGPECRMDTDCPGNLFCLDGSCQPLPYQEDDLCDGVVCDQPPASVCENPDTLLWYESPGTCSLGECTYLARQTFCEGGCVGGDCLGCVPDCQGRECGADGCGGTCGNCPAGESCMGGQCQEPVVDPCDGVVCDQPPANECTLDIYLRVYESPGECRQGECSYAYQEEFCTRGCEEGECLECETQCDGRECGPDGCGGSCAPGCSTSQVCDDGLCRGLESCNGLDDDADGVCDNGFACCLGTTAPCTTSCGTQGVRTCITGCSWRCDPPAETCNGIDDDCNGQVDELDECTPCGTLLPNGTLPQGSVLESCNGRARLVHQGDGNLVFIMNTGALLWNSQTWNQPSDYLVMQGDGNLVLISTSGQALWDSHTWEHPGAHLAVQDDCNLVVYHGDTPIWWTGTQCQ